MYPVNLPHQSEWEIHGTYTLTYTYAHTYIHVYLLPQFSGIILVYHVGALGLSPRRAYNYSHRGTKYLASVWPLNFCVDGLKAWRNTIILII